MIREDVTIVNALGLHARAAARFVQLAGRFLWYSSAKAERELGWRPGPVDAGIAAAWRDLRG